MEKTRWQRKLWPGHWSGPSSGPTRGSPPVPQGHQGGQAATAGPNSWTQRFNDRLHHFNKTQVTAPLSKSPRTPQQRKARPLPILPRGDRLCWPGPRLRLLPLGCRSCRSVMHWERHPQSLQLPWAAGDAPVGPGPGTHPCPSSDLLQEQPPGAKSPPWTGEEPGTEQAGRPGCLSPQEPRSHTPG